MSPPGSGVGEVVPKRETHVGKRVLDLAISVLEIGTEDRVARGRPRPQDGGTNQASGKAECTILLKRCIITHLNL